MIMKENDIIVEKRNNIRTLHSINIMTKLKFNYDVLNLKTIFINVIYNGKYYID